MGRRLRPRLCWQPAHVRAQCLGSQFTAQCLRSQDAHAALGRRGFLRAANSQARAWVRWRNVKVLPAFSKAAGFGAALHGLRGLQGAQVSPAGSVGAGRCPPGTSAPAFPYTKKGGRMSPSVGSTLPFILKKKKGHPSQKPGCPFCLLSREGASGVPPHPGRALCAARSRLPARSALNGAHRAPAPCGRCPAFLFRLRRVRP